MSSNLCRALIVGCCFFNRYIVGVASSSRGSCRRAGVDVVDIERYMLVMFFFAFNIDAATQTVAESKKRHEKG